MKELDIGGKVLRVKATPLTLLFYKQEFNHDLIGDLGRMVDSEKDMSRFDALIFLQVVWAMNKTCDYKNIPDFKTWLSEFDEFDFSDAEMLSEIMEEARKGFFRKAKIGTRRGKQS